LQLIISTREIKFNYLIPDSAPSEVIFVAICSGSVLGFVCSWFSVATILFAPSTRLSLFLLRSLAQQIDNHKEYAKLLNNICKNSNIFLRDKESQKEFKAIFIEAQKEIDNSKAIKLEYLNWNKNSAIKEAGERLKIFENPPSATRSITLETVDSNFDLAKILENFGLIKTLKSKMGIKGKIIHFRDFIERMTDGDNKLDLDVIDAEILKGPARIKIKD